MMKKLLLMFFALFTLAVTLIGCSGTDSASSSNMGSASTSITTSDNSAETSGNTVTLHLDMMSFKQTSITLKAGQNLQLVNDASDIHVISLGTWQNGTAKPEQEPDAPQVNNKQLNANGSMTIGPWKTPGTYYIYCPVHLNMNLTVIVK